MTGPTSGPGPKQPRGPIKQPASRPKPLSPSDSDDSFLLKSPFAKMFRAAGAEPTVKEIRAIINGIIKQLLNEMKRADAQQKKAAQKLKRVIKGE